MKYKPRKKIFEDSARKCSFDPVLFEAKSYGWWVFVKKIGGKIVFNDCNYSNTTRKHQWAVRDLLRELGIKIDLVVDVTRGLQRFEEDAIPELYVDRVRLEMAIVKRGSKKKKNVERRKQIAAIDRKIKECRKLKAKGKRSSISKSNEAPKEESSVKTVETWPRLRLVGV